MVLKANPSSTSMLDAEVPASERVTQTLLSSTAGLAALTSCAQTLGWERLPGYQVPLSKAVPTTSLPKASSPPNFEAISST